jgi:DNA-binding beta-propeller fold protein YncE
MFFLFTVPVSAHAARMVDFVGEYPAGEPTAVVVDEDGNIYAAQKKGTIMVLDAEGKAAATWDCKDGRGKRLLKSPSGLAYYDGRLYVVDNSLNKVAIFSKGGEYIEGFGKKGNGHKEFKRPGGIFVSGGVIYVADTGNDRIQVFGPNGVYIGSLGEWKDIDIRNLIQPLDVAIDLLGNYYAIDGERKWIQAMRMSGEHIVNFVGLENPHAIALGHDRIFIADNGSYKVREYDLGGNSILSFGTKGKGRAQFLQMSDIALDSQGKIYVSDIKRGTVQVFSEEVESQEEMSTDISLPTYVIWVGDVTARSDKVHWDGSALYSIDGKARAIQVIKDGKVERTIKVPGCSPKAVATDPEGFLWVVDEKKNRILKVDDNGEVVLPVGSKGKREGYFKDPNDIAISRDGVVYVSEHGNRRVQRFNTNGVFMSLVGTERKNLFERPVALAMGSAGKLYVLDGERKKVLVFSSDAKFIKKFGSRGFGAGQFLEPVDIEVSEDEVFVLDSKKGNVQVFTTGGGFLREFGAEGNGKGDFEDPSSLTITDRTKIFVSDTGNERIQSLEVQYTPMAPTHLMADSGMRKVSLSWNRNKESYVWRYKLYRSENKSFGYKELATVKKNRFVDKTVKPETRYFYRVSAVAGGGNESIKSYAVKATGSKYVVPSPSGLRASAKPDTIELSWKPHEDEPVSHYVVYRKGGKGFEKLAEVEEASYADDTVLPEKTYEYRVTAVSMDLVESLRGASVSFRSLADTKVPVEIDVLEMENIFSNTYKIYETDGIGEIRVTNNTREPIEGLKVLFTIRGFMDFPSEVAIEELAPKEGRDIRIKAVFNNKILNVTEDTPVQTEIKVTYYRNQEPKHYIKNHTISLYEKHHLVWDIRDRIATFITPKDPVVLEFARQIITQYNEPVAQDTLIYAGVMFEALGVMGVTYLQDPSNPYQVTSGKTDYVDYVQYPRETLKRRSGDCDDLVGLYSSVLESLGIRTKLIDYPGHILMMFSLGERVEPDMEMLGGMFIEHEGLFWVPVEVTMVGKPFMEAWESGSLSYNEWKEKGLQSVDMQKAWETFKPASLVYTEWRPEVMARSAIDEKYEGEFNRLQKIRIRNMAKKYLDRLKADPGDVDAAVQLGIVYADFGLLDDAMGVFEGGLAYDGENAALKNNMGNVHYLEGRYEEAVQAYKAAAGLDPYDSFVLINLSKGYLKLDNKGEAKKVFKKAYRLNKDVFKLYRKMSLELM